MDLGEHSVSVSNNTDIFDDVIESVEIDFDETVSAATTTTTMLRSLTMWLSQWRLTLMKQFQQQQQQQQQQWWWWWWDLWRCNWLGGDWPWWNSFSNNNNNNNAEIFDDVIDSVETDLDETVSATTTTTTTTTMMRSLTMWLSQWTLTEGRTSGWEQLGLQTCHLRTSTTTSRYHNQTLDEPVALLGRGYNGSRPNTGTAPNTISTGVPPQPRSSSS